MRRRFFVFPIALCVLLSGGTLPAQAAHARHAPPRIAPADEYFGRLKMSILGIGNQLRDLDMRIRFAPQRADSMLGSVAWVEDALRDWQRKYPADPWLPKDVYKLTQLYSHVHTDAGRRHTALALHWLLARYGRTWYGRRAKMEFTVGVK